MPTEINEADERRYLNEQLGEVPWWGNHEWWCNWGMSKKNIKLHIDFLEFQLNDVALDEDGFAVRGNTVITKIREDLYAVNHKECSITQNLAAGQPLNFSFGTTWSGEIKRHNLRNDVWIFTTKCSQVCADELRFIAEFIEELNNGE